MTKFKDLTKNGKRLVVGLVTASLICTGTGGTMLVSGSTDKTGRAITAFDELDEEIAYQTVKVGGSEEDIVFPEELSCTLYSFEENEDEESVSDTDGGLEVMEPVEDENSEEATESSNNSGEEENTEGENTEEQNTENTEEGAGNEGQNTEPVTENTENTQEDTSNEDTSNEETSAQEEPSAGENNDQQDNSGSEENGDTSNTENTEDTNNNTENAGAAVKLIDSLTGVKTVYAGEVLEGEDIILTDVTWQLDEEASSKNYFSAIESDIGNYYIYKPVIESYDIADGVTLPEIRVDIEEAEIMAQLDGTADITASDNTVTPELRYRSHGLEVSENAPCYNSVTVYATGFKVGETKTGDFSSEYEFTTDEYGAGSNSRYLWFKHTETEQVVSANAKYNLKSGTEWAATVTMTPYTATYDAAEHDAISYYDADAGKYYAIQYKIGEGEYTTQMPQISDVGTYRVSMKFLGSDSNANAVVSGDAVISARSLANCTVTAAESVYLIGSEANVEPVVKYNGTTLTKGTDYTVTYKNNTAIRDKSATNPPTYTISGCGNYTGEVSGTYSIVGYDADNIDLSYNGVAKKLSWYKDDVVITAPGFKMSTDSDGSFASKYTITGEGAGVGASLYFKDNSTKAVTTAAQTVTVNIDRTNPSGKIESGDDYESKKLITTDTLGYFTKERDKIKLSASDKLSGVKTIMYFIGETQVFTEADIEEEGEGYWKTYDTDNKPILNKNKVNVIYMRVSDNAGNIGYYSTGGIICDTVKPIVSKVTHEKNKVTVTATDELSGVKACYVLAVKKSDGGSKPDSNYVYSNGAVTDGGSVTLDKLEGSTDYIIYSVAVDNAGNVSEVNTYDMTSAKEGLEPTPNGRAGDGDKPKSSTDKNSSDSAAGKNGAGSGSAQASGNAGAGAAGSAGAAGGADGKVSAYDAAKPYIKDATGNLLIGEKSTQGWNKINDQLVRASDGDKVTIEMVNTTVIPANVLSSVEGKNIELKLKTSDETEWTINGQDITAEEPQDIDLGIKMNIKKIPSALLDQAAGNDPHTDFSITHDGEFGFKAKLSVQVGENHKDKYGNLCYYNAEENDLELIGVSTVKDDGNVIYTLEHASDYTIIVKNEPMQSITASNAEETGNLVEDMNVVSARGSARGTNNFPVAVLWIFMIGALCIAMALVVFKLPSMRQDRRTEVV